MIKLSQYEAEFAMMEPTEALTARKKFFAEQLLEHEAELESRREVSQIITRVAVSRDIVAKEIILQLGRDEEPKEFKSRGFSFTVGKRTNLSRVHPRFSFPDRFAVPPDSPDDLAFSFQYVEYDINVYGWAPSTPPSLENTVVTLNVMKANPFAEKPLIVRNEKTPIRIFADMDLYASMICLFWDRTLPRTAGGGWSPRGLLNDGRGCLTTHLSDIGLFLDGREPKKIHQISVTELPELNITDYNNVNVAAYLSFVLVLGFVATVWGFKADERMREDQRLGRAAAAQYWLDGDGLVTPLSVEDPIAYRKVNDRNAFLFTTFINVMEREHVLMGSIFYSETFTRPQRLVCLVSLVTGLLAVNAAIYGSPNSFVPEPEETGRSPAFFAAGVLSALLMFPLYCMLFLMFTCRPTQLKKVLIKRRYRSHDLQRIEQALQQAEREANLAPENLPPTVGSAHKPLVGGLPALPPVPAQVAPQLALPVGGL